MVMTFLQTFTLAQVVCTFITSMVWAYSLVFGSHSSADPSLMCIVSQAHFTLSCFWARWEWTREQKP